MNVGCSNGIFLNSANLICRSADISKCFRGSLQLGDNESQLISFFFSFLDSLCILCLKELVWAMATFLQFFLAMGK